MVSNAKRLCQRSLLNDISKWKAILDDDLYQIPTLISMLCCQIIDSKQTSLILKQVNEYFNWQKYKHVKRIYCTTDEQNQQQKIEILLCRSIDTLDKIYPQEFLSKYFHMNNVTTVQIPEKQPLLKWQYEECRKNYWPNLSYRENKYLEQEYSNKKNEINSKEEAIIDMLKQLQTNHAVQSQHCAVVTNSEHEILVATIDYRHEHPLQHCTMIAIDLIAQMSNGGCYHNRKNFLYEFLLSSTVEKPTTNHLCNSYFIYLTHEPCMMCAMALLHSRIAKVYYLETVDYGALGTKYKLHCLKKTNHRFQVYKLQIENEQEQ
ncbi:unnamed protein product [Didymodactylos carnosus]|uniref:CMP/dCMP-type deaminase domain-containing protein n=1 Tax=Didymodactylos carnosus TaxID=1234261 RepID=A0A814ADZ2_9BILA|nr:unnamed protein product [Didymodactylos carnosus]CAF0913067.1 unnamed protein product [Didymodactylos carnosus]CAF3536427.1 unnamed protein product [Didymodactylos carnosus]CAF3693755.1 unnamed protein product [Didymodactylos carnosus]